MEVDAPTTASSSSSPHFSRSPKRKLVEDVEMSATCSPSSSPLTEIDEEEKLSLAPLPAPILLLHLPAILIHPPNHQLHARSLCMSLLALRRCLKISGQSPDIECRALTSLAEVGMIVIDGGFAQQEQHVWAHGIETEVEDAISKGLMIAQKHPSLRIYRSQLTFLAAQLAAWQNNIKFARMLLRRLLTTYLPSDPPHIIYTAHLKFISHLITPIETQYKPTTMVSNASPVKLSQDVRQTMSAIQAMQKHACKYGHNEVVLLTRVLRLRQLVSSGLWDQVSEALAETEEALGLQFAGEQDTVDQSAGQSPRKGLRVTDLNTVHMNPPSPTKLSFSTKPSNTSDAQPSLTPVSEATPSFKMFHTYFERSMALHTLLIGVVFYTYVGRVSDATQRLSHLHALLDAGALRFDKKAVSTSTPSSSDASPTPNDSNTADAPQTEVTSQDTQEIDDAACGIVYIPLSESSPSLYVQTTHPRILYVLAFLVSCVAKKDPVGRRPKRKIFAIEGLSTWERELKKELHLPSFASMGDLEGIDTRLAKIKADLMCELVGVSIMRSEFNAAEQTLSVLIAHLRNADLFLSFSGRVTLHHAHLAHAQGQTDRAMQCYELAEALAGERGDDFVRISARAGRACLSIGLIRDKEYSRMGNKEEVKRELPKRKTREKSRERKVVDEDAMVVDGNTLVAEPEEWEDVQKLAEDVAEACRGMGGTMWSVGRVIEACLTEEILKSKQHLKSALSFASSAGDNHLRALILALIASHYFHTATDDALGMLGMCENLAAGLGATVKPPPGAKSKGKNGDAIGNAPLRTWVGDRSLEIHKRTGNGPAATKQEAANRALQTLIRNK
ncbi:hypothetical protein J3R30DRAFT_3365295 [Lentinula aciculospora]|uniref:Uncharacterized protein n=1 Tax=Lentinula aciculospora TaxID=153920 RepID=A0A9W9DTU3_9AGAR|nr:hypothetical protein J3R30DRAFT_3365295 [Lentinula aciculospora]